MELGAVIFDLDGVIVDTAEHHYRAWKRLAGELGIACPPDLKDRVRGISRMEALKIVLGEAWPSYRDQAQELANRKDAYYQELIEGLGPEDLLPGALEFIRDLKRHGVKVAVATVSRNGRTVLARLGILDEFDAVVDGHSGARSKPAPDLFLYAARDLGVPPSRCLVVEDAPAGIAAAEVAGMASLALGEERLFSALRPDLVLPDLRGLDCPRLLKLLDEAAVARASWEIDERRDLRGLSSGAKETVFSVGNGYLGTRGTVEERVPGECRATLINGLYDDVPLFFTELAPAPDWTWAELYLGGERFSPASREVLSAERSLDLRDGVLRRRVHWRHPDGGAVEIRTMRFASMAEPHLAVQVYSVTSLDFAGEVEASFRLDGVPVAPGLPPFPEVGVAHWEPIAWGARDGTPPRIQDPHPKRPRPGVDPRRVDQGGVGKDLINPVTRIIYFRRTVHHAHHESRPPRRTPEPGPVQGGVLAAADVVPGPVHPDLHPGVVVVVHHPPGGRAGPGGDRGGPQGRQGDLHHLFASSVPRPDRVQGSLVPPFGLNELDPQGAPAVRRPHGFPHSQAPTEEGLHLPEEERSPSLEGFLGEPVGQDVVDEEGEGDPLPPGEHLPGPKGQVQILLEGARVQGGQVRRGHVGHEEPGGLKLLSPEPLQEGPDLPRVPTGPLQGPLDLFIQDGGACGKAGGKEEKGEGEDRGRVDLLHTPHDNPRPPGSPYRMERTGGLFETDHQALLPPEFFLSEEVKEPGFLVRKGGTRKPNFYKTSPYGIV